MIIQGITLTNIGAYDASFNSNGALLYLDAGNTASYSGSGSTWTDLSGNNNNATLNGPLVFSNTGTASFFNFNGTNLQYAGTVSSKYSQTYTGKTVIVAARIVNIAAGTYRCLFGSTASGSRNFNIYIYSPSSGVYQLHSSFGSGGGITGNLPLTANQWFVVAVTQTNSGVMTFYYNGQPVYTITGQTLAQYTLNSGEAVGQSDNYWYGDISVCAVYGRALSGSEITQNFQALRNRYGI